MRPTPIDLTTWPRRAHFEHYRRSVPCSYAVTVDLDVTALVAALRTSGRRSYVAQTWALATVINRHDELRMCLTDDGGPATWPVSHPMVTVLDPDRETFSALVLPYDPDFATFHVGAVEILERYRSSAELFPQGPPPPNTFDVSSLPWTSFTGFSLQIRDGWEADRRGHPAEPIRRRHHPITQRGVRSSSAVASRKGTSESSAWST